MKTERQHFSDREIASDPEFAGMFSVSTLQKLRVKGNGPSYIKVGIRVFYRKDWVREWIEARVMNSTSEAA